VLALEHQAPGKMIKRTFDILVSATLLVVLSPMMVFLAVLICFKMGKPLLYRQVRPGLHSKPFRMIKFRTMHDARDREGMLLSDSERLIDLGQFLRATSLDELPELWNVLKGDMSLVGPRPLLLEYLPLYNSEQARRHQVRPGITGWAQVNGRNAISWEEKFALDVWYVDHQSLWLDMKIIALTLWKVLRRNDINAPGETTMPRFTGTNGGDR
jgi:lipopolysaccharide/colanic/teichoic acid biosynthesis glycosyltransferase